MLSYSIIRIFIGLLVILHHKAWQKAVIPMKLVGNNAKRNA